MAGFYDQLEAQLADATERFASRGSLARRLPPRLSAARLRIDVLAVSAAAVVAAIVALVFIAAGGKHGPVPPSPTGAGAPTVIRNYAPAPAPPLGGQLVCDSALLPPGRHHPSSGVAIVHTGAANRYGFSITAGGLKPMPPGYVYAFWIQPELTILSGGYELVPHSRPELVGVIEPTVGAGGGLAAEGLLPPIAPSAYRLTITLQPSSSTTAPGKTELEGHVTL